jgi:hypothetical protein
MEKVRAEERPTYGMLALMGHVLQETQVPCKYVQSWISYLLFKALGNTMWKEIIRQKAYLFLRNILQTVSF